MEKEIIERIEYVGDAVYEIGVNIKKLHKLIEPESGEYSSEKLKEGLAKREETLRNLADWLEEIRASV